VLVLNAKGERIHSGCFHQGSMCSNACHIRIPRDIGFFASPESSGYFVTLDGFMKGDLGSDCPF